MSANIHFLYEPGKEPGAAFAQSLIQSFGQTDLSDADTVVSVGGDGILLQALRLGAGKNVCGIMPPGTNSRGFWTNKGVENAGNLEEFLETAGRYTIKPLKASINFADGSGIYRYGYNDVSIRSVHKQIEQDMRKQFQLTDVDVSIQSALINLRVYFAKAVIGPHRVMGTGLIFATPLGSTAMNRNYGGPSVDIREEVIVLTGIGTTEPLKGFNPVINNGGTVFEVEVGSANKRQVMVTFDSFGVVCNEMNSPIEKITISTAQDGAVKLMLKDDPGIRAYSAMMPI